MKVRENRSNGLRRFLTVLVVLCSIISFAACAGKNEGSKAMKEALEKIKGMDGVFAVMETTRGTIVLRLFYKETPMTVTNFVGLAEGTLDATKGKPFYDGLKFHRVISKANGDGQDFMIQGGDPRGNGTGGPGYQFPNEIVDGITHSKPGILAMANSGPDTNGSQFYITIVECPWLDGSYNIFGEVVDGQEVVNTTRKNDVINKVTIVRQGAEAEKFTATQADFDAQVVAAKERSAAQKKAYYQSQIDAIKKQFPGMKEHETGILYEIVEEGTGNVAGARKSVSVDYKGYLIDGSVFDTSMQPGRAPLDFVTAAGRMIEGFDLMTQEMKVGETRRMALPPDYAYGEGGYPPVIPAKSYILFDVTLKSVK